MGNLSGFWGAIRDFFTGGSSFNDSSVTGPIHRLYVGNLSYRVKEEELRALFAKYGKVKTLHLIRDRITRRLKGYAFMEMPPDDARKALELNGHEFLGRKLIVSAAKSKQMEQHQKRSQQKRRNAQASGGPSGGGPNRWRNKRRSGPKVYGAPKNDDTPIQRYE